MTFGINAETLNPSSKERLLMNELKRKYFEKMVGRVGFEPTTNGLKVRNGKYNGPFINVLLGRSMHLSAVLRITVHY